MMRLNRVKWHCSASRVISIGVDAGRRNISVVHMRSEGFGCGNFTRELPLAVSDSVRWRYALVPMSRHTLVQALANSSLTSARRLGPLLDWNLTCGPT